MACGRPSDSTPVLPDRSGAPWSEWAYDAWRSKTFGPALARAGLPHARPYDLRHSFASLLLHEGRSVIYVARQLGHSPALTLSTYGHVIDELDRTPNISAEDAIRAARSPLVRQTRSA